MGHWFSQPINSWVVNYLRSFTKNGNLKRGVKKMKLRFLLNTFLGREDAPSYIIYIKNFNIRCHDLQFDGPPLSMRASKIIISIGKLVVRCDDLGYIIRITRGRITISDIHLTVSYKMTFERGPKVSDIDADVRVQKMETHIKLHINGDDHSRLANVLLTIENPETISKLFKSIFMSAKEDIKQVINENIGAIGKRYGERK